MLDATKSQPRLKTQFRETIKPAPEEAPVRRARALLSSSSLSSDGKACNLS